MSHRPDRLSAIASEALNRGATAATHNLGGLHADIHHEDWDTAPANLPDEIWDRLLTKHRDAARQPLS
ncbi:hypothetical protein [Rhodococcus sp. T7]|uniref:hypothetical protein n=1 Tax=Rhodococcus sp. T7 TaxID=627444 RepID=UPI0013581F6D|nr:hypothetical protein [Rhodococcus sp. T7]KAF0966657.1 hypothetical protein MLGJGCBP_00206 [Rhodococcus sp. T7]